MQAKSISAESQLLLLGRAQSKAAVEQGRIGENRIRAGRAGKGLGDAEAGRAGDQLEDVEVAYVAGHVRERRIHGQGGITEAVLRPVQRDGASAGGPVQLNLAVGHVCFHPGPDQVPGDVLRVEAEPAPP